MENLSDKYKKEKGYWATTVCSDAEGNTYPTEEYVEWLEEKLLEMIDLISKLENK